VIGANANRVRTSTSSAACARHIPGARANVSSIDITTSTWCRVAVRSGDHVMLCPYRAADGRLAFMSARPRIP
jgi:hypothetical protein